MDKLLLKQEVLVFDIYASEPFLHFDHVLHGVADLLRAGSIGAAVTSEADFDRIEKAGRALNVRQTARLILCKSEAKRS